MSGLIAQKGEINMKKENKKIDISTKLIDGTKWETQLPLYLDLYSKLNNEGKKEMKRQLTLLGRLVDATQQRKEK